MKKKTLQKEELKKNIIEKLKKKEEKQIISRKQFQKKKNLKQIFWIFFKKGNLAKKLKIKK